MRSADGEAINIYNVTPTWAKGKGAVSGPPGGVIYQLQSKLTAVAS